MKDAPVLSNSQELETTRDLPSAQPVLRQGEDASNRTYDVLVHYAAVLTVEATDHIDARERAYGSTVLAVFDHGLSLVDETVVGVREADA